MRIAASRMDLPSNQERVIELKQSILSSNFIVQYPSTRWINDLFLEDFDYQNTTYLSLSQVLTVDAWPGSPLVPPDDTVSFPFGPVAFQLVFRLHPETKYFRKIILN